MSTPITVQRRIVHYSEAEILRLAAAIRGRKGGQQSTKKKRDASLKSLEKARKARADKHKAKLSKT